MLFTVYVAAAIRQAAPCNKKVYTKGKVCQEALCVMPERWEQVREVFGQVEWPETRPIQAAIEWGFTHAPAECRRMSWSQTLSGARPTVRFFL